MRQWLFFIYVIIFNTSQAVCQLTDDITSKDCAKFWFDKNNKPLINPNSFSNSGGNTQDNKIPDRGLFATKDVAGLDKPKDQENKPKEPSKSTLHILEYNAVRQFDVLKFRDDKYPNYTLSKQGFTLAFRLPDEYRDILPKKPEESENALSFKFILDESKQQFGSAIEVRFTYEKEILRLHLYRIAENGDLVYLPAPKVEDKLNVEWPENSEAQIQFSVILDPNLNFKFSDEAIPLNRILSFDQNCKIGVTSINKIIATSEGNKKSTVGPIKDWYVYDISEHHPPLITQKRKAIIIANDYKDHKNISPLGEYPLADARGVIKKLSLNPPLWQIDSCFNLTKDELRNKIKNRAYLEGYDTLFIYYAGHGLSYLDKTEKDRKWKDYWVPNDFDDDMKIFKSGTPFEEETLYNIDSVLQKKKINDALYGVDQLLKDLQDNYENIHFNNRQHIEKKVKVMIVSDACREEISFRGLINQEPRSRDTLNVPFEYFFFATVPEGGKASNQKSWTQKYFIENEELHNTPIESLPKVGENYPTVVHIIKSKGKERDEIYQNPFTKIFLMKNN